MKKFIHVQTPEAYVSELEWHYENGKLPEVLVYQGSIKLHGTNAGIVVHEDGTLTAQSRRRELTVGDDNLGFAKWLHGLGATVADLFVENPPWNALTYTVFGEWVGKGIQSGVACCQLEHKQFVAFACLVDGVYHPAPKMMAPFDNVMPVDLILHIRSDGSNFKRELVKARKLTEKIDAECPWAKERGVVGAGEGIVWRPEGDYPRLWLKTKGESHKKKTARVMTEEDKAQRNALTTAVDHLFDLTDGPTRVQQGIDYLNEMGYPVSMKSIPHFIKWFNKDFGRECSSEVKHAAEDYSVDKRKLQKAISSLAVKEYRAQLIEKRV